jgi:hypothetical protein
MLLSSLVFLRYYYYHSCAACTRATAFALEKLFRKLLSSISFHYWTLVKDWRYLSVPKLERECHFAFLPAQHSAGLCVACVLKNHHTQSIRVIYNLGRTGRSHTGSVALWNNQYAGKRHSFAHAGKEKFVKLGRSCWLWQSKVCRIPITYL